MRRGGSTGRFPFFLCVPRSLGRAIFCTTFYYILAGTNSAGGVREEVLPVEVDEEALVRTGSAGALEPKPAGSAGIKGHELRNSVM